MVVSRGLVVVVKSNLASGLEDAVVDVGEVVKTDEVTNAPSVVIATVVKSSTNPVVVPDDFVVVSGSNVVGAVVIGPLEVVVVAAVEASVVITTELLTSTASVVGAFSEVTGTVVKSPSNPVVASGKLVVVSGRAVVGVSVSGPLEVVVEAEVVVVVACVVVITTELLSSTATVVGTCSVACGLEVVVKSILPRLCVVVEGAEVGADWREEAGDELLTLVSGVSVKSNEASVVATSSVCVVAAGVAEVVV